MKSTFGAPSLARLGAGHAGVETSNVRPITPGNACPALYSFNGMMPLRSVRFLMLIGGLVHGGGPRTALRRQLIFQEVRSLGGQSFSANALFANASMRLAGDCVGAALMPH